MISAALKHWRLVLIAGLIAILGAGWLWTLDDLYQERAAHQSTMAQYAHERAAASAAVLLASEQARQREQELTNALAQANEAQKKLDTERSARAADARSADGRVRNAARALAAKAGQNCVPPATGPNASEALDLLAGLLDRVAGRTTELAEYADAAEADASYCRAAHDRARDAMSKD
jgi:hypothetical protein